MLKSKSISMRNSKTESVLKVERGLAVIETIPLLFILVLLLGFSIGFFNIIHTGILHSIAARNYAFETLRYKSDAVYFRILPGTQIAHYRKKEVRFHAVQKAVQGNTSAEFVASTRPISIFPDQNRALTTSDTAQQQDIDAVDAATPKRFKRKPERNPVWLRIGYGLCINSSCGW